MKKIIMLMLAVILFTVAASAEVMTFTFDTAEKVAEWVTEYSKDTEYSFNDEAKCLEVKNIGLDPYISHTFETPFSADTYKYVVYRFKITEGSQNPGGGQFFFSSDTVKRGKPGTYTAFANSATSAWQEIIFDMSKLEHWKGMITLFRFDHVDKVSSPITAQVHSVSFTSTEAEAIELADSLNANPNAVAPVWTFDDYTSVTRLESEMHQMASIFENGQWITEATGGDPKFNMKLGLNEKIRTDTHPYVAFRMKVTSSVKTAGIFFATSVNKSMGPTYSQFDLKNTTGEWAEYIIDMTSFAHGLWKGTLENIRLDPINPGEVGAKFQIDRFGIFKTEDEAQEFLAKEVVLNIVEGEIQEDESKIINTGAKTPKWDLRTKIDSEKWQNVGAKLTNELGFYNLYSDTTDGRFQYTFSEEECFDAEEFHYFAMRYKASSASNVGGLFFTNDIYSVYKDDTFTTFNLNNRGEWKNLIVDMATSSKGELWDGTITGVRIDYLNPSPIGSDITITRLGFFRSMKEANEFLNGGNDLPDYTRGAKYEQDYQSVIVPDGSLYEGFKREEYTMANVVTENIPEDAVVSFTDKNGNESIVALSNVNSFGYTKYVARKPGTYKVSSYSKDYVDTKDHWGASYIDYVSSRKLFGGTSETEFSPDMPMTRGMFITVLGRMHGLDTSVYDGNTGYTDVPAAEYYAPYIQWAKEFSIMTPVSDTVFGAEDPISRKDMAVAIANYINAYEYKFASLAGDAEFNDISALTDAEKEAVRSVQLAAIINGKGEGRFDPMGTSTRAEVATVMQRVIKAILGISELPTEYTAEYFDRDRIRIGIWTFEDALANDKGVKTLAELGADLIVTGLAGGGTADAQNKLLTLTDKYGIEVFASGLSVSESAFKNGVNYKAQAAIYADHPSFNGHYFTDEPGTDSFGWMGDMANEYQAALPGMRPFVNLLPMYANAAQLKYGASAAAIEYYDSDPELYRKHCQAWFENFDVDYICTDIYPLNWASGNKKVTRREYIEYINQIATVARENDAEFWCCIQTFGWTNGKRTPNEAEYRWQSYCMLTFGCTGILLWNYMGTPDFPSLVNPVTYETTQAYEDCKPVMWELRAISDTFVKYRNLGVYTVNCTDGKPDYLAMTGEYKDFTTIKSIDCKDPLLVGCFTAKEGDSKAFTITNMLDFQGNEDKTTAVSFVLDDMSKTVTSYYRGTPTVLIPENGAYNIVLECGDGVFITVE